MIAEAFLSPVTERLPGPLLAGTDLRSAATAIRRAARELGVWAMPSSSDTAIPPGAQVLDGHYVRPGHDQPPCRQLPCRDLAGTTAEAYRARLYRLDELVFVHSRAVPAAPLFSGDTTARPRARQHEAVTGLFPYR
jgi:hypothetical protein